MRVFPHEPNCGTLIDLLAGVAVVISDDNYFRYERGGTASNGTVKVEGVETNYHAAKIVTEIFEGMRERKYDVFEIGLSYFE